MRLLFPSYFFCTVRIVSRIEDSTIFYQNCFSGSSQKFRWRTSEESAFSWNEIVDCCKLIPESSIFTVHRRGALRSQLRSSTLVCGSAYIASAFRRAALWISFLDQIVDYRQISSNQTMFWYFQSIWFFNHGYQRHFSAVLHLDCNRTCFFSSIHQATLIH